jgi:S-methylmethionine-dependent homocysteine/selenocysteine methylase
MVAGTEAARRLSERLEAGELVLIDGGMGSELEARGVPMDRAVWCARANLEHEAAVRKVHEDNIRAGAEVVIANTYPATRLLMRTAGLEDRFEQANRNAVEAAKAAREALGRPDVAVAGSISLGVAVDIMQHGQGVLEGEALLGAFREEAELLAEAGVDLLVLEMIMSPSYGVAAVEAALATGLPVWLGMSADLTPAGDVRALDDEDVPFVEVVGALVRSELEVVTVMHSSVEATGPALEVVRRFWEGPLGAYPESGAWSPPNWSPSTLTPEAFAAAALGWVGENGVQVIGGCCGIGPAHIEALRGALGAGP